MELCTEHVYMKSIVQYRSDHEFILRSLKRLATHDQIIIQAKSPGYSKIATGIAFPNFMYLKKIHWP